MKLYLKKIISVVILFIVTTLHAEQFDLLIKNGRVMDGTGNPWFYANIGIKNNKVVYVKSNDGNQNLIDDINGIKFEILRELATTWYKSPAELVPFSRLERYFEGEEARASLRVRIREIKDSLGKSMGVRFGANDLIMNIRDQGYRLSPPENS